MSQSKTISKVVSRFEIGFDDETKVVIDALKSKMDEVTRALSVKNDSHGDRLLAAMANDAANDAPELLQMGQWVFKGCDPKIKSASVDSDGEAVRWSCDKHDLDLFEGQHISPARVFAEVVKGKFDAKNWRNSAINRQPVNDVDYLSETAPEIQGMEASEIIIDEMGRDYSHNSNGLSAVVPQITQADMQLIFIKNLSDVLIQRMHSMDRFSEDDYAIGGDKLMAWDIVANPKGDFAVITGHNQDKRYFGGLYFVPYARGNHAKTVSGERANEYLKTLEFCTITEAELPAFRAALEACYA